MNNDDNNTLMMIKKVKTKVIISIFIQYKKLVHMRGKIHRLFSITITNL